MILSVTIHPLLERRLLYNKISLGAHHRNPIEELKPGGKGINVCRQINKFGIRSLAYTFLGGNNGKVIKHILSEEKIDFTFIQTKNETRYSVITIDETNRSATTFFGPDYIILPGEADEFKIKLEKMIRNCEIAVFSGSSPCKETNSIFPFGIEIANKYDKISVCDTYGIHLKDCIDQSPTILHNNISEIKNSLNISLNDEKEKSARIVARLSEFLRYSLYDLAQDKVPVEKEIQLLKDYIELESIRLNHTKIKFRLEDDGSVNKIASLLMIPLIENAFKYSPDNSSAYIDIQLYIKRRKLVFSVENSVDPDRQLEHKGGIGLSNFKKRLELYYPDKYEYTAENNETVYTARLNIDFLWK